MALVAVRSSQRGCPRDAGRRRPGAWQALGHSDVQVRWPSMAPQGNVTRGERHLKRSSAPRRARGRELGDRMASDRFATSGGAPRSLGSAVAGFLPMMRKQAAPRKNLPTATRGNLPSRSSAPHVTLHPQQSMRGATPETPAPRGTEGYEPSTRLAAYPSGRRRSSPKEPFFRSTPTERKRHEHRH